ncbi:MAG TPA: FG-GAP-like repeat-containing protein [Pyrinomonadaceae bacterium]|nr:FG-GAP-like repeat-containing protein [Pyrinomonadaceae bacterium]
MSLKGLLLAALICTTAGVVRVAGHATACGNINNEKVFVNALYADILGRDPDREGFRLNRNRIIACGTDANCLDNVRADITLKFFSLNEFSTRTGINVSDNGQFVRALYVYLLRREPNPDGYNHWLSYLNQTGDRLGVVRVFITSDEYRARCFPEAHLLLRLGAGTEHSSNVPDYIAQHWRRMQEQAPFLDGISIYGASDNGIDLTDRLFTDSRVDQYPLTEMTRKVRTATDGWRQYNTFTDNFIFLRSTPPAAYGNFTSWSDDQFWAQVNRNAARMARLAKDSGLKGLFLDPEQYQPGHVPIWSCQDMAPKDFPGIALNVVCNEDPSGEPQVPSRYREILRRRGREFMLSILNEYPDITIMTTFGHSYVSFVGHPNAPSQLHAGFVDGILEAIHVRKARSFHDGIEVYRNVEPEALYGEAMGHFTGDKNIEHVRYWGTGWYYAPDKPLQQKYELGALPFWLDPHISPNFNVTQTEDVIRRMLNASDRYTWLYSERTSFFDNRNVPQDIADALCRAKAEAAQQAPRCAPPRPLFDFDGDGKADVSVFRPTQATWYLSRSRDGFAAEQFGLSTDVLAPADYDGDGKTDIAVWRPANGTWYLQRSRLGFTAFQWGTDGDKPVPGDYDGDGLADMAVFRPSTGTWYIMQSSNNQYRSTPWGISEDQPVPGDYDGDGKTDVAVWRPSNGTWYVFSSQFGTYKGTLLGNAGDRLVPADYDGDGKTDIAVYRPSNGTWYLLRSQAGSIQVQHGVSTDIPVPADYDGDNRVDLAVFRLSEGNGYWYIKRSASGDTAEHFGASGDKPIPKAYGQ